MASDLKTAGYDVVHVAEIDLLTASDTTILERAETDGYVLITADTDFPMLAALRRMSSPSVVLLRGVTGLPVERHLELLAANLPAVIDDLGRGVIVTISPARVRVRDLPIG